MNSLEIITIRHAQPDMSQGHADPSLLADPQLPEHIAGVEERIAGVIPDIGTVSVFTSPKRRTIETGRLLLERTWLQHHAVPTVPLVHEALSDEASMPLQPERAAAHWRSVLDDMSRLVLTGVPDPDSHAIVVVTHAPVIKELFTALPEADLGHPRHVGLLNVRHFTYTPEQG